MDNVQKHNNCINILSPQTVGSNLFLLFSAFSTAAISFPESIGTEPLSYVVSCCAVPSLV
jgi:hypothetical protein